MKPKFPLYIVSKGRWESRLTIKTLQKMKDIELYYVIIEEDEYPQYSAVIDKAHLLILDKQFQRDYDACGNLGITTSVGSGAARNFAWHHAIQSGYTWHWVMDDNIRDFYRLHKNKKVRVYDGAFFGIMEEFCLRYINIGMAGPQYQYFRCARQGYRPFILNSRIYSCNLIRNDLPFRWRGRYNEDTILSLDMLKAGWCTVLFNAFLQGKTSTSTKMPGGNTDSIYVKGHLPKSQMLVKEHPDVARLAWRYGREHHYVDYSVFKQSLKRRPDLDWDNIPKINNFGLELKHYTEDI